jgi:hypothetical protein
MDLKGTLFTVIGIIAALGITFVVSKSYLVAGAIGLLVAVLLFFYAPWYSNPRLSVNSTAKSLSSVTELANDTGTAVFFKSPAATFQSFLYVNPLMRTAPVRNCGGQGQAPCPDPYTAPCECVGCNAGCDCRVCLDPGYRTVVEVRDCFSLQVLTTPDSARQNEAAAHLVVYTENRMGTASKKYVEAFRLPPIPFQKWSMVTVAKEGRRFDVFLNNRLVLSQTTTYMPMGPGSAGGSGLYSGSPGLMGLLAIPTIYEYRMASGEVDQKYKDLADTRGRPYLQTTKELQALVVEMPGDILPPMPPSLFSGDGFFKSMNLCLTGDCLNAPVVQPSNPMYEWSSPYG